ncbi:unnamed protein product [Moneuplotes crassus]|uniref:U1 small nuclear ribonucleoprotein C n=1 Tax=Euplotes crassus TaxID=5936 RepID=A0AAD1XWC7_EUPCR|nr:unnamed protein product [Moneuplotes crassus]
MPKFFCEYCGIYLTHSSPGGRKQHAAGRTHINKKIEYYSQFLLEYQQQQNEEKEKIKKLTAPSHPPRPGPGHMPPPYMHPPPMNGQHMGYPPPPMGGPHGPPGPGGAGFMPPPPPGPVPNNGNDGSKGENRGQEPRPIPENSQAYPLPPRQSVPVEVKKEETNEDKFNPLVNLNISAAKKIASKTE